MEWFLTQVIVGTVLGGGTIFIVVTICGVLIMGLVGSFNRE